jgi:hypothetical protein
MTCRDCEIAQRTANWHGFNANCPDCDIRDIASSPANIRQARFNQVEVECGTPAAQEVRRRVRQEIARILALKVKQP